MFWAFVKIIIGAALVIWSFRLTMVSLRNLLEQQFPGRRALHTAFAVLAFIASQFIGITLLIDPIVPGQAVIHIDAKDVVQDVAVPGNIKVEIAVANFGGSIDSTRIYRGRFDERGIYPVLADFGWMQSFVRVRVYSGVKPIPPIAVKWERVSPWARIGLTAKHVEIHK